MAFQQPIINGNPWPKSWAVQLPILGNNISNPKPSKFQKTLKLAYSRDVRSFRKYYNKNVTQVICSGFTMPKIIANRCKNVSKLELYEHSQLKTKFSSLKSLKMGQLSQHKLPGKTIRSLVRYNKNLQEIWIDKYETMIALKNAIKCPRLLTNFSLGVCNIGKDRMKKEMQFLNRHKRLNQVAICSTEPSVNEHPRDLDKEAGAFVSLLDSLLAKTSLNALKLDVMDPKVIERGIVFEEFLSKKLKEKGLRNFDLRLALTSPKILNSLSEEVLKEMDYFGLSIDGASFQKASFLAEEMLRRQASSNRKFMVDFRGLPELDLDPLLKTLTPNLRVLDLSFNNNTCKLSCNWADIISKLQSLQSLSLNFSNCSDVTSSTLQEFSKIVQHLPVLKYTGLNFENVDFSTEIYLSIDKFYSSIMHIPEHSFGLQSLHSKEVELPLLCNSLKRLNFLEKLKFMVHLRTIDSLSCIGDTIFQLKTLEKLDLHIRLDNHESKAFELPLEESKRLNHLRVELLFRPPVEFLDNLNSTLAKLTALEHLELSILYYSKVRYSLFLSLLGRLNMLKELKELEMSVNLEDESVNESLADKNRKLKKELQDLLRKHPSLTKVIFHHFVSYICFTK